MEKKPDNPWYYYLNGTLIKRRKPCLTGDYVHLKNYSGCYQVHAANTRGFTVIRNRKEVEMPWEQFRCLKGQGDSEEAILRKQLKNLINTIDLSINNQVMINSTLKAELNNLRKTF